MRTTKTREKKTISDDLMRDKEKVGAEEKEEENLRFITVINVL